MYAFQSFHHIQTASSLSFSSGLVRGVHARASGEAARRAKRRGAAREEKELSLPSRVISHARGHLRVSRFARLTTEKRETARGLHHILIIH